MSIKYFQCFYIRSNHGNDRTFLFTLQLCRAKYTQSGKNFIPKNRKEPKCNIMVTVLFQISEQTAKNPAADRQRRNPSIGQRNTLPQCFCDSHCPKQGNSHGAKKTSRAIQYCKKHEKRQISQKQNKICHDFAPASTKCLFFTHALTSPYPSSNSL